MANNSIADALASMEAEAADSTGAPSVNLAIDGQSITDALANMEGTGAEAAPPETTPPAEMSAEEKAVTPGYYLEHGEPGLQRPDTGAEIAEGAVGGAITSVLETKDFLFGEPAAGEKSDLRTSFEEGRDRVKNDSILGGLSVGIGQFAAGMYGLGKFTSAAKALPWFGKGIRALDGAIDASKTLRTAAESAKAATVGAVAFDPHEERLSNLIESGPLANPVTKFLAADPSDTAAEGRMKAALESIGLDAAIIGTLGASVKVYKALRMGDAEGAAKAADAGEAEARAALAPPEAPPVVDAVEPGPATSPERTPTADARFTGSRSFTDEPEDVAEALRTAVRAQSALDPESIKTIDTAFNKFELTPEVSDLVDQAAVPAPEAFTVRRGVLGGEEDLFETFGNKSSVMQGGAADGFGSFKGGKGTVAEIAIQPGTRIFAPNSDIKGGEILFAKDTQFSIVGKAEDGTLQVVAEPRALEPKAVAAEATPGASVSEAANAAEDIPVGSVPNPTEAAAQAGVDLQGTPTPGAKPLIQMSDEDTDAVFRAMEADADAMATHGGWSEAIENGHTFGKGEGIPYAKLAQDGDLEDFMARVVDTAEDRISTIKGGGILTDVRVQRLINQRAALFNEDPASVIGMVQQSGQMAARMVADMEAGYLVTARMLQDTYALSQRIKVGDFAAFGSKEAAMAELKQRLSLAASSYAASRSITANAGRAVRRMRRDFAINPEDVAKLQGMDGDRLLAVLDATGGNPRNLARAANPSWWDKTVDFGQFLLVNNLVSGPKTHLINALTNGYMIGARPLERIIGAVPGVIAGNPTSRGILQEAVKQYTYTGSALVEGFEVARKAFMLNDSILAPHRTELYQGNRAAAQQGAGLAWKPWSSIPNILHNVLSVASVKAIGMPTRALGFTDELVKQTVYRSKVMAKAHLEAAEKAAESGLTGDGLDQFMRDFVRDKLDNAFDDMGRGIDPDAIREANIATFQQDLLANTLGKTIQTGVSSHPGLRLILPFVKTPTNVIRYGWKMSPVLNLAQREYREMLSGKMGMEAQAQAYGQMAMGTLFMGAAGFLISQGAITGGGPKDYKLAQELKATGYQPYAFVTRNADGTKTFTPFNRYDPIAIPLGIIADLQDAIHALGEDATEEDVMSQLGDAFGALAVGLAKQFTSKSYLTSLSQVLEAMNDPDQRGGAVAGQMAANFIPFSAALRQGNPDPYLREARGVVDRVLNTIPGLSDRIPARYDAFGDPIAARKGLWSNDEDSLVDREMQRLAIENGSAPIRVGPTPEGGVDLRDLTLSDGSNAYESYQKWSGHLPGKPPLKKVVAQIMASPTYQNAPDGDIQTKGTKLNLLSKPLTKYRAVAMKMLKADPVVRGAMMKKQIAVRDAYAAKRRGAQAQRPDIGTAFGQELGALFSATE